MQISKVFFDKNEKQQSWMWNTISVQQHLYLGNKKKFYEEKVYLESIKIPYQYMTHFFTLSLVFFMFSFYVFWYSIKM